MELAGRFINIDGIEGSGKSTVVQRLVNHFNQIGQPTHHSREPGGCPTAETLRQALFDGRGEYTIFTELLIISAARMENLHHRVRPALTRGDLVITDRFNSTTYVLQCGRGVDEPAFQWLNKHVCGDLEPDLTLILDLNPTIAQTRLQGREETNYLDELDVAVHEESRKRFLYWASICTNPSAVIDADCTEDELFTRCLSAITDTFGSK